MLADEESCGFDQRAALEPGVEAVEKRTFCKLGAMHAGGQAVIDEAAPLDLAPTPMGQARSISVADAATSARTLAGGHAGSAVRATAADEFIIDRMCFHKDGRLSTRRSLRPLSRI